MNPDLTIEEEEELASLRAQGSEELLRRVAKLTVWAERMAGWARAMDEWGIRVARELNDREGRQLARDYAMNMEEDLKSRPDMPRVAL